MSSDQPPVLAVAEKPEAVASKKKYPLSDSICDDEVILRELVSSCPICLTYIYSWSIIIFSV